MCPAHRRKIISNLKGVLKNKIQKCVCISTRLIEAGVDIDFDGVIRFLAGFDSIIQTAGRCNRNGELKDRHGNPINGKTWIINIVKDEEKIDSLQDLVRGQKIMKDILWEFHENKAKYSHNLMHPDLIAEYFLQYYGQMPDSLLKYKVRKSDNTIIDLLSDNAKSKEELDLQTKNKSCGIKPHKMFRQSFESAWKEFEVIAQDTIGVIVPYERGETIINTLFGLPDVKQCYELLQEAQQFSVNVYFNEIDRMIEKKMVEKVPFSNDLDIYTVNEQYYDQNIGLRFEEGSMPLRNV
jgi:CRISPR-associated endonuclease/helicase Cas3